MDAVIVMLWAIVKIMGLLCLMAVMVGVTAVIIDTTVVVLRSWRL